jgi:outer membrane biosynthesis protein TonB
LPVGVSARIPGFQLVVKSGSRRPAGAPPELDPEEDPAPELDPEEDPAPELDPEEDPAPELDPEEDPAPELDPEEDPAPELDPEDEPAPELDPLDPEEDLPPELDPEPEPDFGPASSPVTVSGSGTFAGPQAARTAMGTGSRAQKGRAILRMGYTSVQFSVAVSHMTPGTAHTNGANCESLHRQSSHS